MQVISTASMTARYGFREMGYELLGMLERVVTRNSYSFHHENNKKLAIFLHFYIQETSFIMFCGVGQLGIFWWLNRCIKVFTSLALEIRIQTIIFYFSLLFGSSIRSKDKITAAGDHSADQNF
jgi:hypothetical protein